MVKFGPSGNCDAFYDSGLKSTLDAPKWVYDHGLNAYEYSFARGANVSDSHCTDLKAKFDKYNIEVSAHAPYYINFGNPSSESEENSINYILTSLQKLKLMGGKRLVVHMGSQGKLERGEVLQLIKDRLIRLHDLLVANGLADMLVCIETMGKFSQIGSYQEIIDLCKISPMYIPTFDFGHINCILQGGLKTKDDYINIIKYAINELGFDKIQKCHIHFSKIQYSQKGELKHLTFEDTEYGPEFLPLAEAIIETKIQPFIICESRGTQTMDAVAMKDMFNSIMK